MAKEIEKKALKKGKAAFTLLGKACVTDKTFNMNTTYDSGWTDNQMYLGVDCGYGNKVFAELRGGFFPEDENVIRCFSKDEKNSDGKSKMIEVAWEDRNNSDILDSVADSAFIKVGVRKDVKGKTVYEKFLSAYDAVEYLNDYLIDGMIVYVKGNLVWSEYDGNINVRKEITSIALSKVDEQLEKINDAERKQYEENVMVDSNAKLALTTLDDMFKADFTQTVLIGYGAIGKKEEDHNTILLDTYVVDYVGKPKIDGKKLDIKKNVVYPRTFEVAINENNPKLTATMLEKFFKVKKKNQIDVITVVGDLIEGGSVVTITDDDIPDDIKELIDLRLYTADEAKNKMAIGGNKREHRMVITKPDITYIGTDDDRRPAVAKEEAKYTEDDLYFYEQAIEDAKGDAPFDVESNDNTSYDTAIDDDELLNMLNGL